MWLDALGSATADAKKGEEEEDDDENGDEVCCRDVDDVDESCGRSEWRQRRTTMPKTSCFSTFSRTPLHAIPVLFLRRAEKFLMTMVGRRRLRLRLPILVDSERVGLDVE